MPAIVTGILAKMRASTPLVSKNRPERTPAPRSILLQWPTAGRTLAPDVYTSSSLVPVIDHLEATMSPKCVSSVNTCHRAAVGPPAQAQASRCHSHAQNQRCIDWHSKKLWHYRRAFCDKLHFAVYIAYCYNSLILEDMSWIDSHLTHFSPSKRGSHYLKPFTIWVAAILGAQRTKRSGLYPLLASTP